MSKFKVRDRVRVVKNGTTSGDKDQYIGKTYIIESVFGEDNYTYWGKVLGRAYSVGGSHVIYEREMVLAEHPKIVITTDGTTTLARLYEGKKVVKSAKAVCSPEDTFDFAVGAQLAYDRLKPETVKLYCVKGCTPGEWLTKGKVYDVVNGQITFDDGWTCDYDGIQIYGDDTQIDQLCVPLVRRPAKVGEFVYVIAATEHHKAYANGDVLKVVKVNDGNPLKVDGIYVESKTGETNCGDGTFLFHKEYLVLDGYQPEPEACKCCGRVMSK